jgi:hypothetical protein
MHLAPPPKLSDAELLRLVVVVLPAPAGLEPRAVYRFEDTGEFIAEDAEVESQIRTAFPGASIRRI